eukprot:CAMPEP_0118987880 /NCGR_PEP_ID=MMETSP1173-20130426/45115_1 /TAXON_ID=1034831 /ORGANISM="Rhizochromulina marina cf, Strain CCMP1243" /LENGTH=30 /DNA_ID= /DNA_START= /DNA_END= /DNA_ORIENTATION=
MTHHLVQHTIFVRGDNDSAHGQAHGARNNG